MDLEWKLDRFFDISLTMETAGIIDHSTYLLPCWYLDIFASNAESILDLFKKASFDILGSQCLSEYQTLCSQTLLGPI